MPSPSSSVAEVPTTCATYTVSCIPGTRPARGRLLPSDPTSEDIAALDDDDDTGSEGSSELSDRLSHDAAAAPEANGKYV